MVHLQDSILEHLHHHTLFSMLSNGILEDTIVHEFYHVSALGGHLTYNSTNLSNLSIIFPNFLHNV